MQITAYKAIFVQRINKQPFLPFVLPFYVHSFFSCMNCRDLIEEIAKFEEREFSTAKSTSQVLLRNPVEYRHLLKLGCAIWLDILLLKLFILRQDFGLEFLNFESLILWKDIE